MLRKLIAGTKCVVNMEGLKMNTKQKIGLGIITPLAVFSVVQTALSNRIDNKEKQHLEISNIERAVADFDVIETDTTDMDNLSIKFQQANEQLQKQIGKQNIYYHKINK